ncbi:hypothetical protein ACQJBY_072760 [Aegilops geniculata]
MGRKGRRRPRRASPADSASASTSTGQGGRRQRRRPPPPPPPENTYLRIIADLGDNLLIMVLFETPSGFAVFYADGISPYEPDAMENLWGNFVTENRADHIIWRKDFQVFTDKADAINLDDGLNSQLTDMLQPAQKLAVGKPEYKTIIEARLGIPCLFDEPVLEVMRGLNYLMHSFFPEEKSKQAEGECLRTSRGLRMLVERYGFDDVKLDNVNECIIETACMLNDCDRCLKAIGESWRSGSAFLEVVSSIDSQDWDTLKMATALKMVCFPEEKIVFGDPHEMFSADELSKLVADAHKYEDCGIRKGTVGRLYNRTVFMYQSRVKGQRRLSRRLRRHMKKLNEK